MSTTVMKFGGTSVADAVAIGRLVAIVRGERERRGSLPVVVVSAMSGVTDRLLGLAASAGGGDRRASAEGVDELWARHRDAAGVLVGSAGRAALLEELEREFEELRAVLAAIAILRDASPRSLDGIAAYGELASSRLVAAALQEAGIESAWIDARQTIVTDDAYTSATPASEDTQEAVTRVVVPHVLGGRVPVVGGFVGATREGVTTTLGRGGSDYSAALIGAALCGAARAGHPAAAEVADGNRADVSCREVQIWTDVDGMLTADPRIVDAPRLVSQLSFGEASELAYFGAKVLHPSTILPAIAANLPVRILNSRSPDGRGTLITANPPPGERPLAALACKRAVTVIEVTSTRMLMAHGFLRRLFEVFERHRTSVDVVTTSEVSVSVTVDDARHVGEIAQALREFADVTVERDMALLCAVGDGLRTDPTLALRVLATLEGFPLRMVSQAASRRNLTVVLPSRDVPTAMSRLHQVWFTSSEPGHGPWAIGMRMTYDE